MGSTTILLFMLLAIAMTTVECNSEGDALNVMKSHLVDPNNVLQSWDPKLVNPCSWFHVTCNNENRVVRVDLGNANLSGILVPRSLGLLHDLQYLELYGNHITGSIPADLGKLTKLVSLDLYENELTGNIPASLGYLRSIRFLRLNSNKLTGNVPVGIFNLIQWGNLQILDISDNYLAGTHKTGNVTTYIIQDAKA